MWKIERVVLAAVSYTMEEVVMHFFCYWKNKSQKIINALPSLKSRLNSKRRFRWFKLCGTVGVKTLNILIL